MSVSFEASLAHEVGFCLFRVAQEALNNAIKHSGTREIAVGVLQTSQMARMQIRDLGSGFDPRSATSGIGLASMRERLRMVGGEFFIRSASGQGTEIVAQVTLTKGAAAGAEA